MAVGRAALIAVPFLAVVVVLLAAGDAVFASLLLPGDLDVTPVVTHTLTIVGLTLAVLGAVVAASARPVDGERRGRFGSAEIVTMLALAAAVLALFVVSQLVALTGAGRGLVEEAGLTPAEYARSGFFQLSWATAFLVVFLALVRALARPEFLLRTAVRGLGAAVPLLATGLVVVSLRRMALYDRAFGLTMLRLWVVGAALWMGALLLMLAVRNGGFGGHRNWVVAGSTAVALVLVVAADLGNAEAFVARHNIGRVAGGSSLDVVYLRDLSDDAVPAIGEARNRTIEPILRNALTGALRCGDDRTGVAALNVAAARAAEARRDACRP